VRDGGYLLLILIAAFAVTRLLDRLERQLRREKAILASMGEGLAVTDNDDRITYLNPPERGSCTSRRNRRADGAGWRPPEIPGTWTERRSPNGTAAPNTR